MDTTPGMLPSICNSQVLPLLGDPNTQTRRDSNATPGPIPRRARPSSTFRRARVASRLPRASWRRTVSTGTVRHPATPVPLLALAAHDSHWSRRHEVTPFRRRLAQLMRSHPDVDVWEQKMRAAFSDTYR